MSTEAFEHPEVSRIMMLLAELQQQADQLLVGGGELSFDGEDMMPIEVYGLEEIPGEVLQ